MSMYVIIIIIIGLIATLGWLMRPLARQHRPTRQPLSPITDQRLHEPIPGHQWDIGTGGVGYAWHAPQPRGIVLIQHGYADYALRFVDEHHQLIPRLLEQHLSVYAIDLWGHGYSPGNRGVLDVRDAVADHGRARALLAQHQLPIVLIGHSLGGLVCVASALQDPEHIAGVVLLSPALPAQMPAIARGTANLLARIAPNAPVPLPAAPESGLARDRAYIQRATDDPLIYHSGVTNLVAATALDVNTSILELRSHWGHPTLIQHGDADTWAPISGSTSFFDAITTQDKQFIRYPDGRHNLLCDSEQARVYADILTWLQKRIPTA